MKVSVIVITRHITNPAFPEKLQREWQERKAIIAECLPSSRINANYPHELVVVCNGDAQHYEYIESVACEIPIDKIVHFDKPIGASGAREIGYMNSGGDLLAFIDDDMYMRPKWLSRHIEFIESRRIDMTRCWFSIFPGPASQRIEMMSYIRNQKTSEAAMMIARNLYERAGGFKDGRHWSTFRKALKALGFYEGYTLKPIFAEHRGEVRRKLFRDSDVDISIAANMTEYIRTFNAS